MDAPTFAELLRRYRRFQRMTQAELAERAGISSDAISLLERGLTQAPQKATVRMLSVALSLAPDEAAIFTEAARSARQSQTSDAHAPSLPAEPVAPDLSITGVLPLPLTPLIGREQELATLSALFDQPTPRLVTLTGPAGVGKTRLALELAATLWRERGQDVVWVGLIPVQEPERVLPAIAQALGIQEQGGLTLREALIHMLHERRLLLLLDNFEQALPAARAVLDLLIACPQARALVTSRAPLNVRGERCFPVAPLALPDLRQPQAVEELRQAPSVELFLERVGGSGASITTPEEARLVADICVQLDGLPLAIELAAARVRHFGLPQLHARLTQPTFLGVLSDGAQDLADHQRTMRSTIAWSYDLLNVEEQRIFRWLGVFVGGASIEAIETVTELAGDLLLADLATLLDASLLQYDDHGETRRYSQLVTLRAYAQERLRAAGELEEARRRHAEYYATLTDALFLMALNSSERQMARVEADYENVRAALHWALETDNVPAGLRMVAGLWRFWFLHSQYLEGLDWLERVLAQSAPPTNDEERELLVEAWTGVMALSHRLDSFERARDAGEMALTLCQQIGDDKKIARALNNLSNPVAALRDYARAVALCEECLRLLRATDDHLEMIIPLLNLGDLYHKMGQPREALAFYEESLALSHEAGESDWARALTWNNIGEVHLFLDEPARAIEVVEPSYHLFTEKGDSFGAATCAFTLGRALWRAGASEAADARLEEAERLFGAMGNVVMVARVRCVRASLALERTDLDAARDDLAQAFAALAGQAHESVWVWRVVERVATLLSLRDDLELAARLYAAAMTRHDTAPEPTEPAERERRDGDLARLRAALPAPTLAVCRAEGHALTPAEAIALARAAVQRREG